MDVEVIKANSSLDSSSPVEKKNRLRVAAYCRVSTDDEEQLKSYESMVAYYTDYIKKNSDWAFVGVYADEAETGTMVNNRNGFKDLIADCLNGKIDLVLAKSLSRFARNTLDTLKYVRMLKEKGIGIYFENENINSLKDGEFLLTILSAVAQQEVENTSANVKKGLKMKMKRGEIVGFQGCLGYNYDPETKTISINEEEAEIVRYIFERYISGIGSTVIARELNKKGWLTIRGNQWSNAGVMGIIKNEKYKGDLMMGKTITIDPISKRRVKNFGEEDRYYIKGHHEPIISEDIFDKAQQIRDRRNGGKMAVEPGKREKYSRQYAFSSIIQCGFCGCNLSRRQWHSQTKYGKTIWQCSNSTKNGMRFCPDSKGIPEEVIEQAFLESYRILCNNNKEVLDEFLIKTEKTLGNDAVKAEFKKYKRKASEIKTKRKKLLEKYLDNLVAKDIYQETDAEYIKKLAELDRKKEILEKRVEDKDALKERISEFRKTLSNNQVLETFDRSVFESIVEKIIVGGYDKEGNKDPYKITFIYKSGFDDEIDNSKKRFGKKYRKITRGKPNADGPIAVDHDFSVSELCSNKQTDIKELCSDAQNDACGDGCPFEQQIC